MRRIHAVALAVVLTLSAGCGGDDADEPAATTTSATVSTSTPGASTTGQGGDVDSTDTTQAGVNADDEAFFAGCRAQSAAVRDNIGDTDFDDAMQALGAWEASGCEAACGPLGTPTDPRCIET